MPNLHPTTSNMRRFLNVELHGVIWSDIDDPTALEIDDWVFNPADHAHYAGRVVKINKDLGTVEIEWHKTENDRFREVMWINASKWNQYWWLDPIFADGEE